MIKEITSKDNNKLKHAASLKEAKYRKEYNEFLSEGKKSLDMALNAGNVKEIFTVKPIKNIPDDINAVSISRDYLFAVSWIYLLIFIWVQILATVNPEKYVELYNNYKKKLSDKSANKWSSYQVHLNPEIAEKLKNFTSCGE